MALSKLPSNWASPDILRRRASWNLFCALSYSTSFSAYRSMKSSMLIAHSWLLLNKYWQSCGVWVRKSCCVFSSVTLTDDSSVATFIRSWFTISEISFSPDTMDLASSRRASSILSKLINLSSMRSSACAISKVASMVDWIRSSWILIFAIRSNCIATSGFLFG